MFEGTQENLRFGQQGLTIEPWIGSLARVICCTKFALYRFIYFNYTTVFSDRLE